MWVNLNYYKNGIGSVRLYFLRKEYYTGKHLIYENESKDIYCIMLQKTAISKNPVLFNFLFIKELQFHKNI